MGGPVPYDADDVPAPVDPVVHRPGCGRRALTRRRVVAWQRGGEVLVEVSCAGCGAVAVVEPGPGDVWVVAGGR